MEKALAIINEIEDKLGWPQSETIDKPPLSSEQRKLVRTLNRLIRAIAGFNDWQLLRAEASIALVAAVKGDGDKSEFVTATINSDTVTVDNVTFTESFIGRAFQVTGDEVVYRIVDIPTPTSLKLDRAWINASIVVADKRVFTIAMDRYALPTDFERGIDDIQNFFGTRNIRPVSPNEFKQRRRDDRGIIIDEPEIWTLFGMNDGQTQRLVHFHPYPDKARLLRYDYQQVHPLINSDNDLLIFPDAHLLWIVDTVYQMMVRDYEDDSKTIILLQDMLREYNQQLGRNAVTETAPRIRHDAQTRRDIQIAYGIGNLRINWGTLFDRSDVVGLVD